MIRMHGIWYARIDGRRIALLADLHSAIILYSIFMEA